MTQHFIGLLTEQGAGTLSDHLEFCQSPVGCLSRKQLTGKAYARPEESAISGGASAAFIAQYQETISQLIYSLLMPFLFFFILCDTFAVCS